MKGESITVAIPTHCRSEMLSESFQHVLGDPRVREIVISDDCSQDGSFERIVAQYTGYPKVQIHRNKKNIDCYRNKRQAVELATSAWVVLFDDDNVIKPDYLDTLFRLPVWDPKTIYCPDWAMPHFNYTAFAGHQVDRRSVGRFMAASNYRTALNTANYFVNRAVYLETWDGSKDPVTADSMFHAYNHLVKGGRIIVVAGLRYLHRIHEGSHYKKNLKRTGDFGRRIELMLRSLR
jgi:glycosyltransferase involved in cell wall biosynthesis